MSDQEKAITAELAIAYREMMQSWAFKDLMVRVEAERADRVNMVLNTKGADNLEAVKGFNSCVDFIKGELGMVTELRK